MKSTPLLLCATTLRGMETPHRWSTPGSRTSSLEPGVRRSGPPSLQDAFSLYRSAAPFMLETWVICVSGFQLKKLLFFGLICRWRTSRCASLGPRSSTLAPRIRLTCRARRDEYDGENDLQGIQKHAPLAPGSLQSPASFPMGCRMRG